MKEISVVVCTHNRISVLPECIDALLNQSITPDRYEVIIVDNNSTDGTDAYARYKADEIDNVRYVSELNQGLSFARNRGLREAKAEFVSFVDDDALCNYNFLEVLLKKFTEHPEVVCIGGRIVQHVRTKVPGWMTRFYKNYLVLGYDQGPFETFLDTRHGPVGANVAFRKAIFRKVGMFDTKLGRIGKNYYANEEELLLRKIKETPKSCLYTPDAWVIHIANPDRIGRKYLIKRAYDKGVSDARAGYLRGHAIHYLARSIIRKLAETISNCGGLIIESFFFHGVVMSVVYKYTYYRERVRLGNIQIMPKMFSSRQQESVHMLTPKQYEERLLSLRDKYSGKRCFIVGNGPSLNLIDLQKLNGEFSFAVNAIFLKTDEMGYQPSFYVVEDNAVVVDNLQRINAYQCEYKFFPAHYKKQIIPDANTIFLPADFGFYREGHPSFCVPRFSKELHKVVFVGQSVTYLNLQLAYYLGFSKVYLVGMDFSYQIPESTIIEGVNYTSQGDDPNHFHPDYFGKGKVWHDPKLDRVLMNYEMAKKVFEADGRAIYNATVGGKLEIFPRVEYHSLF